MEDDAIISQREAMEDSAGTKVIKEEESGPVSNGGLLDQIISTIIPTEKGVKSVTEEEQGGKGEGGILENLISDLTSPRASNPVVFEFFEAVSDEEHEQEQKQQQQQQQQPDKSDGGGGLMDSIVSHIPPISISENEGPNSDEASMLIHVVQD